MNFFLLYGFLGVSYDGGGRWNARPTPEVPFPIPALLVGGLGGRRRLSAGDGTPALQLLTAPSTLLRINETAVPRFARQRQSLLRSAAAGRGNPALHFKRIEKRGKGKEGTEVYRLSSIVHRPWSRVSEEKKKSEILRQASLRFHSGQAG